MATPAQVQQINNLLNTQVLPSLGWQLDVPQWAIEEMANQGLTTAYDIGEYLGNHIGQGGSLFVSWDLVNRMPWMRYGMSATSYDYSLLSLNDTWMQLTGQQKAPDDIIGDALRRYHGQMQGSQFRDYLMSQDSIKNAYGWLRYGLDYQQFQEQKLGMRTEFGQDLTDQQAVVQLQYLHAAQGSNQSAAVQPTFTQQERKQANVGVAQSEVR